MSRLIMLALASLTILQPAYSQQRYTFHELGSVQGGYSSAQAISNNGKAAGYAGFQIYGDYRPAIFQLGQLPEVIYTDGPGTATGINSRGDVVGWYQQGPVLNAFLWNKNSLKILPSLGNESTVATAINNRGEVVGWSHVAPGVTHAFHYYKGKMTDLGSWGGISAQATAINEGGDIVGHRDVMVDGLVVKEGVRVKNGKIEILNKLVNGRNVVPLSINEKGNVAGYLYDSDHFWWDDTRAFVLKGANASRLYYQVEHMGTTAYSLNNANVAVGYWFDGPADPRQRGIVWGNAKVGFRLDYLPEALAMGWSDLGTALAINNDGAIVGWGFKPQSGSLSIQGYMLIPVK